MEKTALDWKHWNSRAMPIQRMSNYDSLQPTVAGRETALDTDILN